MAKLERRPVLSQGLLLAQRHSCRDAASSGQKHPYEDTSGCQDQPPWHNARYARYSRAYSSPPMGTSRDSRLSLPHFILTAFLRVPQMS